MEVLCEHPTELPRIIWVDIGDSIEILMKKIEEATTIPVGHQSRLVYKDTIITEDSLRGGMIFQPTLDEDPIDPPAIKVLQTFVVGFPSPLRRPIPILVRVLERRRKWFCLSIEEHQDVRLLKGTVRALARIRPYDGLVITYVREDQEIRKLENELREFDDQELQECV